jgi:uracil-DNA glycosylase
MDNKLKGVQEKLYEQLKESGWANKLKTFILSDDFLNILRRLANQQILGKRFTPTLKNLFRAFEQCPYDELKVVFVGQDPYPKEGVADGIAFSCKNTSHPSQVQPSLRAIYKGLEKEGINHSHFYDLADWSKQGILMLNTALTTEVGKAGAHAEIWDPFIVFLLDTLNHTNTGITYVFMGKVSQKYMQYISADNNYIFTCSHPASAAYTGGEWDSNGVFKSVTDVVKQNFNYDIKW